MTACKGILFEHHTAESGFIVATTGLPEDVSFRFSEVCALKHGLAMDLICAWVGILQLLFTTAVVLN